MNAVQPRRPEHRAWRSAVSSSEIAGIMDGKAEPDYARCVDLCTKACSA